MLARTNSQVVSGGYRERPEESRIVTRTAMNVEDRAHGGAVQMNHEGTKDTKKATRCSLQTPDACKSLALVADVLAGMFF